MINNDLRPSAVYPTYPPYHSGEYLEEYFFRRFREISLNLDREYIDIFWTNLFNNRTYFGHFYPNIQEYLNSNLKSDSKYFTVCQFDDGPLEDFPNDTLIFSAGGNRERGNIIPIPLICSSIPTDLIPTKEKTIFTSFVGSRNTHPIRTDMCKYLSKNTDYLIISDSWTPSVSMSSFQNFVEITCSSKYSLAPRGYGKQSFRLYEILQLGSVPVYISDEHYLPWMDEIDWNSFCVPINEDEIEEIDDILKSIDDVKYNKLLENGKKVYDKYFTLEGMFQNIIKRLQ